jgi:hypothetical protein
MDFIFSVFIDHIFSFHWLLVHLNLHNSRLLTNCACGVHHIAKMYGFTTATLTVLGT